MAELADALCRTWNLLLHDDDRDDDRNNEKTSTISLSLHMRACARTLILANSVTAAPIAPSLCSKLTNFASDRPSLP